MQSPEGKALLPFLLLFAGLVVGEEPELATRCGQSVTLLTRDLPAGARVAITVRLLDGEDPGWRLPGRTQQPLASLTKLFVSAAAWLELGPDYAFATRLVGLGPPGTDGRLPGLGVIGGGDPCLDEHFTDRQPDRIFDDWAAALVQAGIKRIAGDLVIDSGMFAGPIRPGGYPQDAANLVRWYSAPASAFAWNDNCIECRVLPTEPGRRARVEVRPCSSRITVVNRTTTARQPVASNLVVSRDPDANRLVVTGSYSKATSWFPMAIHQDPDLLAGDHLVHRLAVAGIAVDGTVRLGAVDPGGGTTYVHHRSPLLPALTILNQRSQNFYGEQILRILGHCCVGEGSVEAGCRAVTAILARDLGLAGFTVVDGSGLSAGNSATTDTVVALLAAMWRREQDATWADTLKERWHRKVRCRVKTGSLSCCRALAGYIPAPGGATAAFAFIIDRDEGCSFPTMSALRDCLFAAIVDAVCGK